MVFDPLVVAEAPVLVLEEPEFGLYEPELSLLALESDVVPLSEGLAEPVVEEPLLYEDADESEDVELLLSVEEGVPVELSFLEESSVLEPEDPLLDEVEGVVA